MHILGKSAKIIFGVTIESISNALNVLNGCCLIHTIRMQLVGIIYSTNAKFALVKLLNLIVDVPHVT
jgi:hypothetical protein